MSSIDILARQQFFYGLRDRLRDVARERVSGFCSSGSLCASESVSSSPPTNTYQSGPAGRQRAVLGPLSTVSGLVLPGV